MGEEFQLLNGWQDKYRGFEFIQEYIDDQLDGGDILLLMEVINLDGQWIQGYAEDIIILECWRVT